MAKLEYDVLNTDFTLSSSNGGGGFIVRNQSGFSTLYRLADLVVIIVTWYCCHYFFEIAIDNTSLILVFCFCVAFQLFAEASDVYRSWRGARTSEIIKVIVPSWCLTCLATLTFGYFMFEPSSKSPLFTLSWFTSALVSITVWRYATRAFLFRIRTTGMNSRQAIIIGATKIGQELAQQIRTHEGLGIRFLGMFDDRQPERLPESLHMQVKGSIQQAIDLARQNKVDYIYIALPMGAENRIKEILHYCSDTTANVYLIPNFFVYNLMNSRWQSFGSVQALSIFDTPFQGASEALKRLEDIILSILILMILAIPMTIIAAAVKLTSPGPAVFKQKRYGLDGKQILVYKFRSMSTQDNGNVVKQATKNDPRITKLGAFLRKTSLDELPQFINVLQGRMSIVGPRPHAVAHNEEYRKIISGYMLRHKVRPGITGWAQINGFRGETDTVEKMEKRVQFDLDYIHNWSVWLDIKIIVKTAINALIDKNAY